ncbi:MAG: hypothetical protein FWG98_02450 [Candidatus Cloacimonetes bacterium]|nr:hypothetical protein [Candidatus Cloacimonadota bacterium]
MLLEKDFFPVNMTRECLSQAIEFHVKENNDEELAKCYGLRGYYLSINYIRSEEAKKDLDKAIEIYRKLLDEKRPIQIFYYAWFLSIRTESSWSFLEKNRDNELALITEAINIYEKYHSDPDRKDVVEERLFEAYRIRAEIYSSTFLRDEDEKSEETRYANAIIDYQKCIEIGEILKNNQNIYFVNKLAMIYFDISNCYKLKPETDLINSNKYLGLCIELYEMILKDDMLCFRDGLRPVDFIAAYMDRAKYFFDLQMEENLFSDINRGLELYEKVLGEYYIKGIISSVDHDIKNAYIVRGELLYDKGKLLEAIEDYRKTLRMQKDDIKTKSPDDSETDEKFNTKTTQEYYNCLDRLIEIVKETNNNELLQSVYSEFKENG